MVAGNCIAILSSFFCRKNAISSTRKVVLEGSDVNSAKKAEITGDDFFSVQIHAVNGTVEIAGKKLLACGKPVTTTKALNSEIG